MGRGVKGNAKEREKWEEESWEKIEREVKESKKTRRKGKQGKNPHIREVWSPSG